jgi:hypothetical protein
MVNNVINGINRLHVRDSLPSKIRNIRSLAFWNRSKTGFFNR